MLAISTPAANRESVMYDLVEHGRAGEDPSFYFAEFAAPAGCAVDDEDAWREANPALGDFASLDAMRSVRHTTRESTFRQLRLGQWVQHEDAWLPAEQWAACEAPGPVPDGADVVVALDGSYSQDCTALVVASVSPRPHLDVVALWEPPADDPDYRVPVADVEETIRQACRRWQVREVCADPFRWNRSLQALAAEGLPMAEHPQSPQRMTPATTGLYEAVVNRQVTHSGDAWLARHVANATVKDDARGTRLAKERRNSPHRIDLAVCAVMTHARARHYATRRTRRRRMVVLK